MTRIRRIFVFSTAALSGEALINSASAQAEGASAGGAAVDAFLQHPLEIALIVGAALGLGVLLARLLRRRPQPAVAAPAPRRSPVSPGRHDARAPGASRDPGMIFRDETGAPVRQPAPPPPPVDRDSRRVFDYFEDSFGLRDADADAVIDYLERVGDAIERQRAKLARAEDEIDRLVSEKAAREAERRAGAEPAVGGGSAALRLAIDGVRTARTALQPLRARSDAKFALFAAETEIEDALRRVVGLHSAHGDGAIDPSLIEEPWPHALWRADMLLSAYFPSDGAWIDLRDGLSAAAIGLRRAFREVGVIVGHVRLLSTYRSADGEIWAEDMGALEDLEDVRAAAAQAGDGAILDCETFGYVDRARGMVARARLIVQRSRR